MKKISVVNPLSAPKSSQKQTDIIPSQPAQSGDVKKASFGRAGHQTQTSSEEKPEPISQSLHFLQDLDDHAVLFFSSFSKNLYQLPIFEQSTDKVLQSFTFQAFLDQLKYYRSGDTDKIPEILIVVGKLYRKDLQSWLKVSMKELFTWSDIYVSQILFRNNSSHCKVIADFMLNVCRFYYRFVSHSRPIQTFREFMSHPIYDHSKPYNWFALPDYVSYSQVLMALYCQQEKKPFPSALPKEFITQSNLSLIAQFHKMFSEDFPHPLTIDNVKIPHSLYKKCWLAAQSGSTIRPYDIEICFYFVQQQKISLNFVVDELWTEGSTVGTNSYLNIQVIPLMKNFTIYDWKRLEIMNAILLSENNPDIIKAWKKQASKAFFYKKSPLNDGLGFLAISRADLFLSHHDALDRFYSLQGYKPIYHLVQASIINSQVTQSVLLWQTQASNKEYDNLYLNIIAHAFGTLSSYAGAILQTKSKLSQNLKHLPKLTQTMISEFPLNGILGLIAKINPKFNDLKHLTDFKFSTRQKTENNSENSCLLSKFTHLTSDQKLALSSLKPLPLHIPKCANQVILNLEKSKPLQDLIAHHGTIFTHKSTRLDLGALSEKLQNKQGVFAFQISQNPKFAASAIQDLNALIITSTQKINPNGLVAARALNSIPQEEWEKSTAYPDLNFLLNTSPQVNFVPLPELPGETIPVGETNDSELEEDAVDAPVQQQMQQAVGNSQAESEEMKVNANDELRVSQAESEEMKVNPNELRASQGAQDNGMNQTGLTRMRAQRDLDQPENGPDLLAGNSEYGTDDFFNDNYGGGGAVPSDLSTEMPPTEQIFE